MVIFSPTDTRLIDPPPIDYKGFKNGNSPPLCYFSNFFGGSEFTFMAFRSKSRQESPGALRLASLYLHLRDYNWETPEGYSTFKRLRKTLQPSSKDNDYYFKSSAPDGYPKVAAGIIAKLISGCYRPSMKTRLKAVNKLAEEFIGQSDTIIRVADLVDGTAAQKKNWMKQALIIKFSQPFYKTLLHTTHPGWLWEAKGRDSVGSNFPGKDGWLKTILLQVKQHFDKSNQKYSITKDDNDDLSYSYEID